MFSGRENNMAGRKKEDPIAPTAFAGMEPSRQGKAPGAIWRETECGSEWAAYVCCWVNCGNVVEERGMADRMKMDSRNASSMSMILYASRISLQRTAASLATSRESRVTRPPRGNRDQVPFGLWQNGRDQCSSA